MTVDLATLKFIYSWPNRYKRESALTFKHFIHVISFINEVTLLMKLPALWQLTKALAHSAGFPHLQHSVPILGLMPMESALCSRMKHKLGA